MGLWQSFRMKYLLFIFVVFLTACSQKAEIKTELKPETGEKILSTKVFNLGDHEGYNSNMGRRDHLDGPISIQFVRVDHSDKPSTYEVQIFADGLSPRLKIKKENSLILKSADQSVQLSPSVQKNDEQPIAEYFPSFRRESATYANITVDQLSVLTQPTPAKIIVEGESRSEEVPLRFDAKEALQALIAQP
jgi:hypothetical protein